MKIVLVHGDDWQGLYRDGELVKQGHVVHLCDILDVLGVEYDTIEPNQDWLEARGTLPAHLSDVKEAE